MKMAIGSDIEGTKIIAGSILQVKEAVKMSLIGELRPVRNPSIWKKQHPRKAVASMGKTIRLRTVMMLVLSH